MIFGGRDERDHPAGLHALLGGDPDGRARGTGRLKDDTGKPERSSGMQAPATEAKGRTRQPASGTRQ